MTERPRFLPEGIHLGRTIARTIEVAHSKLPLSARVYITLEDQIRNDNLLFPELSERTRRAERVLWRVIKQPKVLKSMTDFFEKRDHFIKPRVGK